MARIQTFTRCFFKLLFLAVVNCWKLPSSSISIHITKKQLKNIAASSTVATTVFTSTGVYARELSGNDLFKATQAIETVERVTDSLKYVQEDIANKGDATSIVQQVKFLLNNYKLRDNIKESLSAVEDSKREHARTHGTAAYEDLAQIFEYYEDDIDDSTGKKTPPREVLTFAQDAVAAAKKELQELISDYPASIVSDIESKLKSESS